MSEFWKERVGSHKDNGNKEEYTARGIMGGRHFFIKGSGAFVHTDFPATCRSPQAPEQRSMVGISGWEEAWLAVLKRREDLVR